MRISSTFERLKAEGRPALIAYVTAGDPTPAQTAGLVAALERGGADMIELGVPFSDPVADGPVIQAGAERALKAGTTLRIVLEIAEQIRAHSGIPLILFTYLNPVLRYGVEALAHDAAKAGIDGILLTDLTVEEADSILPPFRAAEIDTIFMATPTSTPQRLKRIADHSSGFVYIVSRLGVTGERSTVASGLDALVGRLRELTQQPLAAGFGISKPEHAVQVGRLADGVAIGSAFVRFIEENRNAPDLEARLEAFTGSFAKALGEKP